MAKFHKSRLGMINIHIVLDPSKNLPCH